MKKQKYYVVWKGRRTGIYPSWQACSAEVTGFVGAQFKSFDNLAEAESAYRNPYSEQVGKPKAEVTIRNLKLTKPLVPSICVDAACAGVPGPVEWRAVETQTARELFKVGPYPEGTNNVGEFLAIVQGLGWLKEKQLDWRLYSDSKNALLWVKIKKCRTKLAHTRRNAPLFDLIAKAEIWLAENQVTNQVLKWETKDWGENPADFGRK